MKKILAVVVLMFAGSALAAPPEVLVLNSAAVKVTGLLTARRGVFIQNNGPNAIWCGFQSAHAVLTKSFKVDAGATWTVNTGLDIWCRAATADQVTGAATTVIEVP